MRGAVSKGGSNASLGRKKREGMEKSKRARKRKLDTAKVNLKPLSVLPYSGGQGVHREVESEGYEEKYRAP